MYFNIVFEDTDNPQVIRKRLREIYGQIAVTELQTPSNYAIITSNSLLYDIALSDHAARNLDILIQVVLTDESGSTLTKCEFMKTVAYNKEATPLYYILNTL